MISCECCNEPLRFRWSDTHGIGVCSNCGMPYTIYHYEGNVRLTDKPPEIAIQPEGVALAKRYWAETHRRVFPAAFDMGIGRGGRSYSGATAEDCEAFAAWMKVNDPAQAEASPEVAPA
jgi:hypothetical protein